MTSNKQRAAEIVGTVRSGMVTGKGARRIVTDELDAAEERGRAEIAARVEALAWDSRWVAERIRAALAPQEESPR